VWSTVAWTESTGISIKKQFQKFVILINRKNFAKKPLIFLKSTRGP
jgi:hypothetical protein